MNLGFANMESIVRPFVPVVSTPTPNVPPAPPPVTPESFLQWGKESTFNFDDSFRQKATNVGFHTKDDDKPKDIVVTLNEIGRTTSDVRIENPSDSDQYVIVQKITAMSFKPDGLGQVPREIDNVTYKFQFAD